jgi:shikimate dehydrogenase
MGGQRTALPIPARLALSPRTVVFDLIYRPRQTRLLQRAQRAGCRTVNGWPMLVAQADAAFQIWTGHSFPANARRALLQWKGPS